MRPAALSGRELGGRGCGLHWKDMAILSIVWGRAQKDPPALPSSSLQAPSRWANELGSREPADTVHRHQPPGPRAQWERLEGGLRGERGHGAHPTLPTVSSSYPLLAASLVQDHVNSVTVSLGNENVNRLCSCENWGKLGRECVNEKHSRCQQGVICLRVDAHLQYFSTTSGGAAATGVATRLSL